jgi:cyclase
VKTRKFKDPVYLGDCFNTVRLFNEKEVDELIILDITASPSDRPPNIELLHDLAGECFMPAAYGGGIRTMQEMVSLFAAGFEKVSLNTSAVKNPNLIKEAAREFGSQSVVVSIDVRKKLLGSYEVYINGGRDATGLDPVVAAQRAVDLGAGEILLTAMDRDGMMDGFDLGLVQKVSSAISIPLVACGGAGSLKHIHDAIHLGGASAVAAGSYFVFMGKHRAVLITYPSRKELMNEVYQ